MLLLVYSKMTEMFGLLGALLGLFFAERRHMIIDVDTSKDTAGATGIILSRRR